MNWKVSKLHQDALKQISRTNRLVLVCSILSVIIFPIGEGITIQKFHDKPFFWYCITLIALAHLAIGCITIFNTKTLPQYVVEYEALEEKFLAKCNESDELEQSLKQSQYLLVAVWASVNALRNIIKGDTHITLEEAKNNLDYILKPLIELRSEVLGFWNGEARYNFCVYLYDEDKELLEIFYRQCDDRIPRRDRTWKPGFGHVGMCYLRKKTIISQDIWVSEEFWQNGYESDKDNYRSLASTPIIDKVENVLGVFSVTSSITNQLSESQHGTMLDLYSSILTLYFQYINISMSVKEDVVDGPETL